MAQHEGRRVASAGGSAGSVEVDVDEERHEPAEGGEGGDAPRGGGGEGPDGQCESGGGDGEHPRAGVLPTRRQDCYGASVKNWPPCAARRIAFQASGPAPAAAAPVTITTGRRGRAAAASTAAAASAERAAP